MTGNIFQPELVWLDGMFTRGKSITVEDGIIISIGEKTTKIINKRFMIDLLLLDEIYLWHYDPKICNEFI